MTEDAQYRQYVALLTLSQTISCFDIVTSTESIESDDRQNSFWYTAWSLDGTNCVDKRTYNCEENNGK